MLEYNGYIKVINFGVAKDITGKDYINTFMGTAHYMAPEIILGKNYNCSVDYWSLGIILSEIFYVFVPFESDKKDIKNVYNEIIDKKVCFPIMMLIVVILMNLCLDYYKKIQRKELIILIKLSLRNFLKILDFDSLLNLTMKGCLLIAIII